MRLRGERIWLFAILICVQVSQAALSAPSAISDYVLTYAPLVYLDVNEEWLPSDLNLFVSNTKPEVNFTVITNSSHTINSPAFTALNKNGGCTFESFDQCPIYLTVQQNITGDIPWLRGTLPDPTTGQTKDTISSAVIVNDHGSGHVDAYYFYWYAFNKGLDVGGTYLGNHVGDWEHTMLRFRNGQPDSMWYSAHEAGFAYTYAAVPKNGSRPIVYASKGGHANYPTPGLQSRDYGLIVLNDTTSAGALWDPVKSAFFYTFTPSSPDSKQGNFTPVSASGGGAPPPVDWLYFLGRWGDKQYPDSNPLQVNLGISRAYEDGPTGPYDKDLNRREVCPDRVSCTTSTALPAPSGIIQPLATLSRSAPSSSAGLMATSSATTQPASTAPAKNASQRCSQINLAHWLGSCALALGHLMM